MGDYNTAPHRAFRLSLVLDADTREDLARALHNIASRVGRSEITKGVSGGYDSGCVYELLEDPAMTHEAYFEQVRAYLEEHKADSSAGER